jgi:ribosomal protein S18 acetylase RimI-like enzyme
VNIRSATPADAAVLLDFWLRYAEPSHTDDEAGVAALVSNPACDVLMAEDGQALIGTVVAGFDGWRANMYRLAVDEARRRQGIARALIAAAEQSLLARGARRISAIVIDGHDYAVKAWQSAGYERQDTVGRYVKTIASE